MKPCTTSDNSCNNKTEKKPRKIFLFKGVFALLSLEHSQLFYAVFGVWARPEKKACYSAQSSRGISISTLGAIVCSTVTKLNVYIECTTTARQQATRQKVHMKTRPQKFRFWVTVIATWIWEAAARDWVTARLRNSVYNIYTRTLDSISADGWHNFRGICSVNSALKMSQPFWKLWFCHHGSENCEALRMRWARRSLLTNSLVTYLAASYQRSYIV